MKWEYYIAAFSWDIEGGAEKHLNTFGNAGWELISIHNLPLGVMRAIFKRPKP